jgi:hypothetical protein
MKLGGSVAGLLALSYVIGALYCRAYFSALGAPWVIDLLSYSQITRSGALVAAPVGIMALASIVDMARTGEHPRGHQKLALWTTIIGIVPLAVGSLPKSVVPPEVAGLCILAAGVLLAIAAGFTVAELIGNFWHSNYKWTAHHLQLVFSLQSVLLLSVPYFCGSALGGIAALGTTLPRVEAPLLGSESEWRLIRSLDAGFLIMIPAEKASNHQQIFQIIPQTENVRIKPPSRHGT